MARIAQYRSQVGMARPPRPQAQPRDYVGAAMQQFGGALTNVALAMDAKERQREAFEDEVSFRRMKTGLDTDLFEAQTNMSEDGRGFTDGFLSDNFKARTDEYLQSIDDPELRQRRTAEIGLMHDQYALSAAKMERSQMVSFQTSELEKMGEEAFVRINNDPSPENLEREMTLLGAAVDASNLSLAEKGVLKDSLRQKGAQGYLASMASLNPMRALLETGGDITDLSKSAQASILTTAVQSSWVSPRKDADHVGVYGMRAEDAARLLAKEGINTDTDDSGWHTLLSNPTTARVYAQQRMEELIEKGYEPEQAIVAYFMGEEILSTDWKRGDLPKAVQNAIKISLPSVTLGRTPAKSIPLVDKAGNPLDPKAYDQVDPGLVSTAQNVFSMFGYDKLVIHDAERKEGAGYGASKSQHILFHADGQPTGRKGALDISVAQLSVPERVELIEALSAAGVTGIGVYRGNFIHIDLGPRRGWGNRDSEGKWRDIPGWARDVVARHAAGEISWDDVNRAGVTPFVMAAGSVSLARTQQAALKQLSAQQPSTQTVRSQAADRLDDLIAAIESGVAPQVTSNQIRDDIDVQTPEQQSSYRDKIETATVVKTMTESLPTMSNVDMTELLQSMDNPGWQYRGTRLEDTIRNKVEAEVREVEDARKEDPAGSVMGFPGLQEAWVQAVNPQTNRIDTAAMGKFIAMAKDIQLRQFGLPPSAVRHLPQRELEVLGSHIVQITRNAAVDAQTREALLHAFVSRAQLDYGAFSGAVLLDALKTIEEYDKDGAPEKQLTRLIRRSSRGAIEPNLGSEAPDPVTPTPLSDDDLFDRALGRAQNASDEHALRDFLNTLDPAMRQRVEAAMSVR